MGHQIAVVDVPQPLGQIGDVPGIGPQQELGPRVDAVDVAGQDFEPGVVRTRVVLHEPGQKPPRNAVPVPEQNNSARHGHHPAQRNVQELLPHRQTLIDQEPVDGHRRQKCHRAHDAAPSDRTDRAQNDQNIVPDPNSDMIFLCGGHHGHQIHEQEDGHIVPALLVEQRVAVGRPQPVEHNESHRHHKNKPPQPVVQRLRHIKVQPDRKESHPRDDILLERVLPHKHDVVDPQNQASCEQDPHNQADLLFLDAVQQHDRGKKEPYAVSKKPHLRTQVSEQRSQHDDRAQQLARDVRGLI